MDLPYVELGEIKWISQHLMDGITLYYVVKGKITAVGAAESFHLGQEDIHLCNEGEAWGLHGDEANVVLTVFFSSAFLARESPHLSNRVFYGNSTADDHRDERSYFELRRSLNRLMTATYKSGSDMEKRSIAFELLHILETSFLAESEPSHREGVGDNDSISGIMSYIGRNFRTPISLSDLAEREHLSTNYLSRFFKQKVGCGFLTYVDKLRLESAVRELTYTATPILKIAMNNGFSSAAAFNRSFRKTFGQSPAEYRKGNNGKGAFRQESTAFQPEEGNGGFSLAQYLNNFDLKYSYGGATSEMCRVDLSAGWEPRPARADRIVKIGTIMEALHSTVQEQLREVRERLGMECVHFRCIFGDGMCYHDANSMYRGYEYEQVFEFLRENRQRPILCLDISALLLEAEGDPQAYGLRRLEEFLSLGIQPGLLSDAKVELCCQEKDRRWLARLYGPFYDRLKEYAANFSVGLQIYKEYGEIEGERFLRDCHDEGRQPDFLTVYTGNAIPRAGKKSYTDFRRANADLLDRLKTFAASALGVAPPLYLMEWNTLCGGDSSMGDDFCRVALIADALLVLDRCASAVAVWISTRVLDMMRGSDHANVPSLFAHRQLRRSAYFVFDLLNSLDGQVYCATSLIYVTGDGRGTYTVLIYNPCYFDPEYASDTEYTEAYRKKIACTLGPLEGKYTVQRKILDQKGNGLLYKRWGEMGFPKFAEGQVASYLEQVLQPDLYLYSEDVTGEYTIAQELTFNGMAVVTLKPENPGEKAVAGIAPSST